MSETAINDYLTKQINVNKNIVCRNLHSERISLIKVKLAGYLSFAQSRTLYSCKRREIASGPVQKRVRDP